MVPAANLTPDPPPHPSSKLPHHPFVVGVAPNSDSITKVGARPTVSWRHRREGLEVERSARRGREDQREVNCSQKNKSSMCICAKECVFM